MLKLIGVILAALALFLVPLAGLAAALVALGVTAEVGAVVIAVYAIGWIVLAERNWDRLDPAARRGP